MWQLFERVWPYLVVLAPGVFALVRQFHNERRASRTERTDLIKIAQEAAGEVIQELRDEADRLRTRIKEIEDELANVRRDYAEMMLVKDARIALLEGELRQKEALIHSYEELIERAGLQRPVQGAMHWIVDTSGRLVPASPEPLRPATEIRP